MTLRAHPFKWNISNTDIKRNSSRDLFDCFELSNGAEFVQNCMLFVSENMRIYDHHLEILP